MQAKVFEGYPLFLHPSFPLNFISPNYHNEQVEELKQDARLNLEEGFKKQNPAIISVACTSVCDRNNKKVENTLFWIYKLDFCTTFPKQNIEKEATQII